MKTKDIASQYNLDLNEFEYFAKREPSISFKTGFVDNTIDDCDVARSVELYKESLEREKNKEKERQISQEEKAQIEKEKQVFAKSFNEFYEYDVVTIINEDHGRIDKRKMMEVLASHAQQGWKLHTIYSNELGKDALRIMGFGVNKTACEDVLIFERRIEKLS